jgi:hypothetical protein
MAYRNLNFSVPYKKTIFETLCKNCFEKKVLIGNITINDIQRCPILLTHVDLDDTIENIGGFSVMSITAAEKLEELELLTEEEAEKLLELL